MIHKINLTDKSSTLYKEFETLYTISFPIFEQRTALQQSIAFDSKHYHLEAYLDDDNSFIGFISYWEFHSTIYIEHLAVNNKCRGKGYGTALLNEFISHSNKTVILEIDPITDDVSAARLKFYERCGFNKNAHTHHHPPYRNEYTPHALIILSTPQELTIKEYNEFNSNLINIVMQFEQ